MQREFVEPLLIWYDKNKRKLPWRDCRNAYYTWVSEIMLQQTRVEAVKPYFERFVRELPDVASLAACPEEKLLKLWEGLGYYSRVRNMRQAAVQVMEEFGGTIPESVPELLTLKGIGAYTAGAIASIAYGGRAAAVDGNVLRVVSRITESREDITKQPVRKKIERELESILPAGRAGDFNQALMELGALVCVPNGAPKCGECPVSGNCLAFAHGVQETLPVKAPKKTRVKELRTVFVIQDGNCTAIRRRPSRGLLAGLYELPNTKGHLTQAEALEYVKRMELEALHIEPLPDARHIFSHIEWRMRGYRIRVSSLERPQNGELLFVDKRESEQTYAIPSAFEAYVKYMKEENV